MMDVLKALLTGLLLTAPAAASPNQDLTPEEFQRLHKEIRPRAGEALWAEIPWTYDLYKARAEAAREGKPLCVWRMAGDPTASC
jgi:hypothetical protein